METLEGARTTLWPESTRIYVEVQTLHTQANGRDESQLDVHHSQIIFYVLP